MDSIAGSTSQRFVVKRILPLLAAVLKVSATIGVCSLCVGFLLPFSLSFLAPESRNEALRIWVLRHGGIERLPGGGEATPA
jgi:cyclic lactone autoinducer peptide